MNSFKCESCQKIFEAKATIKRYTDPIYGPCWERISKCPNCGGESHEFRQKSTSGKRVDFDSYVETLRNSGGRCGPGGGCCG